LTQIVLLTVLGTLFVAGSSVLIRQTRKQRGDAIVDVRGDAGERAANARA
jgi:hypothetical protein